MTITDVRIFPVDDKKLKAFVSIIVDNCFLISDIKIIEGTKGLFLSMPSKKRKDGSFKDIAHPLNSETRKMMEDVIFAKYREEQPASLTMPQVEEGSDASDLESGQSDGEDPEV
ncbi:MAG: septation regulator SpoVG, partial [Acidobacteriota bacterium]